MFGPIGGGGGTYSGGDATSGVGDSRGGASSNRSRSTTSFGNINYGTTVGSPVSVMIAIVVVGGLFLWLKSKK